jgi:hypothetical protein
MVCRERIIKIIDQPSVDWKIIYQRANSLRDTIHEPRNLAALFYYHLSMNGLHSSLKLLRSLIQLDLNICYTYGELLKRIENRPAGKKVFKQLADEGKTEHEAFLKALDDLRLGPRRKKIAEIKSYYPEKFSNEDLRQEAILGAWNYWQKVKATTADEVQFLRSPIRLPTKRSELWEALRPVCLQAEAKLLGLALLPILRGEWDRLPDKAYQALRNIWGKQKTAKRDGIEWGKRHSHPKADVEAIILKKQVIRAAGKHLGPMAAKALEHRFNVDTDKEAAKLAGITDRTYRNYVKKLREILKNQ